MALRSHLALIGYRASGKSTLAKLVAEQLGCPWIDLDVEIERLSGVSIADMFEKQGEQHFRDVETACLKTVCEESEPSIIATGGGIVLRPENADHLRAHCQDIVYLEAPVSVLSQRLEADAGGRPSLSGRPIAEEVAEVLEQRLPLYEALATKSLAANNDLQDLVQRLLLIVEN